MAGAVESYRTDQHVLTAYRTLADHRGQRHTIDITLDQHRREDTSLRVEASVEHCRMPVKISLYLMRQDKAVTEDTVAVPLASIILKTKCSRYIKRSVTNHKTKRLFFMVFFTSIITPKKRHKSLAI